uniref:Mitochondrial splicing suppressor 51-like C-terminal domain-containing protein n=1 Tax=Spongospora subterranea TaxID=70186 RepID=A0A0H5RCN8_9EUKA|eukprot:CRZ11347.1 hypothetical protein [Spongospora subterranea]
MGAIDTRSNTIVRALSRLAPTSLPSPLTIHIAGADGCEQTRAKDVFRILIHHVCIDHHRSLQIVLIGPNIADNAPLLVTANDQSDIPSAEIRFVSGIYSPSTLAQLSPPHLVFMFQAGVWAYDTWRESIAFARFICSYGVVITAYNIEECEDDEDRLVEWGLLNDSDWLWRTENNASAFEAISIPSPDIPGRMLTENQFWLALSPVTSQRQKHNHNILT